MGTQRLSWHLSVSCQIETMMRDSRHTGALTMALAAAILAAGCSHATSTDANSATTPSTIRIATAAGEFVVQGDILKKYNSVGGTTSPLGLPITDEQAGPNGGRYSRFEGGAIYWTAQTGAHIVWGAIRAAFENDNGAHWATRPPMNTPFPAAGSRSSNTARSPIPTANRTSKLARNLTGSPRRSAA